jgi:hypothetical protein
MPDDGSEKTSPPRREKSRVEIDSPRSGGEREREREREAGKRRQKTRQDKHKTGGKEGKGISFSSIIMVSVNICVLLSISTCAIVQEQDKIFAISAQRA